MYKKIILGIGGILLLVGIILISIYAILPLSIRTKVKTPIVAVVESSDPIQVHLLKVSLNNNYYEIQWGEVFDVSNVDISIEAEDSTSITFEDGTTSKIYDSIGNKEDKIIITDNYNNSETVGISILVVDTIPPEITGVENCSITEGRMFYALNAVFAMDIADGDVSNTLMCSDYDIDKVGTQLVKITASDKSGNIALVEFELEIIAKPVLAVEFVPEITHEEIKSISTVYREVIPYDGKLRSVTCWGDSLTEGYIAPEYVSIITGTNSDTVNGLINPTETTTLAKLTGLKVYNMGIWGEDSRTIAGRQGGLKMNVNNITIPASGSVSFDHIISEDGSEVYPLRVDRKAQEECFDACSIGGIIGRLTYTNNDGIEFYTFERAVSGSELVITSETQIITATAVSRRDDILVIEMGNNNGWDQPNYEVLINQYIAMIEYSNCKYFIIVGDTDGLQEERKGWDLALETAFGDHFIRMREYLATNGMTDCGLTPTDLDLSMMADISVPYSLTSDWSHLNAYGYYSKGKAIYERGIQLGYWK